MNEQPLVSVILATYNGNERLTLAIESILNQDYKNYEVVIVDDSSTSLKTKSILDVFKTNPKIKLVANKNNLGLAGALNVAITASKGAYLVRMDDDDIAHPNRISTLMKAMVEFNYPAVVGSNANLTDGTRIVGCLKVPTTPSSLDVILSKAIIHPTTMLKRKSIENLGGYTSSPNTLRLEDFDLWCRLLQKEERLINISDILLDYYESTLSVSKRSVSFRVRELKLKLYWRKKLGLPSHIQFYLVIKFLLYIVIPKGLYLRFRKWRYQ